MISKAIALVLGLLAVGMVALSQPADAAQASRSFSAYDLTQCSCTYSNGYAFVKSAPTVTAGSYYDTTPAAGVEILTYQRVTGNLNSYRLSTLEPAVGSGGYVIEFAGGNTLIVMCWADNSAGVQMDKVSGWSNVPINGAYRRIIAYIDDRQIPDYVRLSGHHC